MVIDAFGYDLFGLMPAPVFGHNHFANALGGQLTNIQVQPDGTGKFPAMPVGKRSTAKNG